MTTMDHSHAAPALTTTVIVDGVEHNMTYGARAAVESLIKRKLEGRGVPSRSMNLIWSASNAWPECGLSLLSEYSKAPRRLMQGERANELFVLEDAATVNRSSVPEANCTFCWSSKGFQKTHGSPSACGQLHNGFKVTQIMVSGTLVEAEHPDWGIKW